MSLPWVPRFIFGPHDITLTYPIARWNPGGRTEGRVLKSVTGVLGPSLRLRKYTLSFLIRYTDVEWQHIIDLFSYAQLGDAFTWYPHAYDVDQPTSVSVFLESPHVNSEIKPTRDTTYLSLLTVPIVVSRMGTPFDLEYFKIPAE